MNLFSRRVLAIACIALSLTCSNAYGQSTAGQTAVMPLDPAVVTGKLSNGFTYYIRRNTTPEKRAVMYLVNKVGSILETDQQRGLAHFLEHMAFNGTKHFPKHALVDYLQKAGVRFGADLNAYTSFDETVYQLPVSTENKELFNNTLQILRDWAHDISLDDDEIDAERGIILEEKRQHLGAGQRVQEKTLPVLANGSLYAWRSPIGTEEVLKNFNHETLRQFYHDWYRPDLQALIIVGDINVSATEKAIRSLFSDIPLSKNAKKRPLVEIPLSGKSQFVAVADPELTNTRLQMTLKFPAVTLNTHQDFREELMRQLFGVMMSNRFNEILQQKDAPFLSAGAGIGRLMGNLDGFSGSVSLKPDGIEKGVRAWWTEIERVKQYGFTESELKRAVTYYSAMLERQHRQADKTPSDSYVREYMQHFLQGTATPGTDYEYDLSKELLNKLMSADFVPFLEKLFRTADRDIVLTGKDGLPGEATVSQWLQKPDNLTAYVDKAVTHTALLDKAPTPGAVVSTAVLKDVEATILTLSNGVKVVLKPTDFKKDEILFSATSPGGFSLVSDADFYAAGIAAGLVNASGVADMTLEEVRRLLNGKVVAVAPYISEIAEGMSGSSSAGDLETALQLVYLYFTAPRKDPVVFNHMIEQLRLVYANRGNVPGQVFNDTLAAVLGNYHFRKMSMPESKLGELDADRALEIYRERFADASDFTFTFVGSFDTAAIRPLLEKYLGSLPSLNRQDAVKDLHLDLPTGRIARKVIKGKDPRSVVMLIYGGPYDYNKEANNQLQALAGTLNIMLLDRIREQEAGVYSVNVQPEARKLPSGQYAITVNFICDPQNVEPLILSVNSEIMKLKMQGPAEDDVKKFKEGRKSALEVSLKQNAFWLNYLATKMSRGETPDKIDIKELMQAITPQSLQKAATTFFNMENYIRVVLVPER